MWLVPMDWSNPHINVIILTMIITGGNTPCTKGWVSIVNVVSVTHEVVVCCRFNEVDGA